MIGSEEDNIQEKKIDILELAKWKIKIYICNNLDERFQERLQLDSKNVR